jgi:hypothetical protein
LRLNNALPFSGYFKQGIQQLNGDGLNGSSGLKHASVSVRYRESSGRHRDRFISLPSFAHFSAIYPTEVTCQRPEVRCSLRRRSIVIPLGGSSVGSTAAAGGLSSV